MLKLTITDYDTTSIYVDPSEICAVGDLNGKAKIYLRSGHSFTVLEKTEEVARYLAFKNSYNGKDTFDTLSVRTVPDYSEPDVHNDFEEIFIYACSNLEKKLENPEKWHEGSKVHYEQLLGRIRDYKNRFVSVQLRDVE